MTRTIRFALGFLVATQLSHAAPEALEIARKDLAAAMRAEDEARLLAGEQVSSRVAVLLRNLDSAMQKESQSYVENSLQSLAEAYRSDDVQACVVRFREELTAEAKRKQDEALAECEALLNEVREALMRATKPAELDPLIDKLDGMKTDRSGETPQKIQEAWQSLRNARRTVANWQDSLQAAENGNGKAATQSLRNVLSSDGPMLVPRSYVLDRIEELQGTESGFAESVATIKELEDIAPVLSAWRKLAIANRGSSSNYEVVETVNALSAINQDYQQFKAGLPAKVNLSSSSSTSSMGPYESMVIALRGKLQLLLLPRYVGAPEGTTANPGEETLPFLQRLAREAKERGDGAVALKASEAARLMFSWHIYPSADSQALKSYMAGQNQEAAGQIMLAVGSYQDALKSGSELVPAKQIGERLDALQKAHPEDYEKGMEIFFDSLKPAANPMEMSRTLRSRYGYPVRDDGESRGPGKTIPAPAVPSPEKPTEGAKDKSPTVETVKPEKPAR